MLKLIKNVTLLSLCIVSSIFPMRQIAQIASQRLHQASCLRNSAVLRCSMAPLVAMRHIIDDGTFQTIFSSQTDESESASLCMARSYSDQDMAAVDMSQHAQPCCPTVLLNLDPHNNQNIFMKTKEYYDRGSIDTCSQSSFFHDGQASYGSHQPQTEQSWQRSSIDEKLQERSSYNNNQSQQHLSEILHRAQAASQIETALKTAKSSLSNFSANYSGIVQQKARSLTQTFSFLSIQDAYNARSTLQTDLLKKENDFADLCNRNHHVNQLNLDQILTPCGGNSDLALILGPKNDPVVQIPDHVKDAWTIQDCNYMGAAIALKADIDALKMAIEHCNMAIRGFQHSAQEILNNIDKASADTIEIEIIPDLIAKKEALNSSISLKETDFSQQKNSLNYYQQYEKEFNSRSLLTRAIDRTYHGVKTYNIRALLNENQNKLIEQQEQTTKELQRLYDQQAEYTSYIDYARNALSQKKAFELQEAAQLEEKQKQEISNFNLDAAKSNYESCSFDINDCPSRVIEKQWLERQEALQQTKDQNYEQYDQSFHISPQTAGFLAANDIDYTKLKNFFGTSLQQQFHGEICYNFEKAALLQRELPYQSNFLQASVLLADAAYDANKDENIQLTIALNNASFQFLDTVETYALAAAKGSVSSFLRLAEDCAYAVTHIEDTVEHFAQSVESLGKSLYYVFETIALPGCAEQYGGQYIALRDQRDAEISAVLSALGEKISNSTGPEIVEALTSLATNYYVSGKIMHAVGTALGAVKNELKAAYATQHLATTTGHQAALSENARDLAQTVQKIEQVATEKVASQVADQLINAEKHLEASTHIAPKSKSPLPVQCKRLTVTECTDKVKKYGYKIPLRDNDLYNNTDYLTKEICAKVNTTIDPALLERCNTMTPVVGKAEMSLCADIKHIANIEYKLILDETKSFYTVKKKGGHLAGTMAKLEQEGLVEIISHTKFGGGCVEYQVKDLFTGKLFTHSEFPPHWNIERIAQETMCLAEKSIQNGELTSKTKQVIKAITQDNFELKIVADPQPLAHNCTTIENTINKHVITSYPVYKK